MASTNTDSKQRPQPELLFQDVSNMQYAANKIVFQFSLKKNVTICIKMKQIKIRMDSSLSDFYDWGVSKAQL